MMGKFGDFRDDAKGLEASSKRYAQSFIIVPLAEKPWLGLFDMKRNLICTTNSMEVLWAELEREVNNRKARQELYEQEAAARRLRKKQEHSVAGIKTADLGIEL